MCPSAPTGAFAEHAQTLTAACPGANPSTQRPSVTADSTMLPSTTHQASGWPTSVITSCRQRCGRLLARGPPARQPQPPRIPHVPPQARPQPTHRLRCQLHMCAQGRSHTGQRRSVHLSHKTSPCRAPYTPPRPAAPRAQKKARACYSLSTLDACTSGLFFASRCRSIVL